MEIGSEVYSKVLALQIQKLAGTLPAPEFSALRLAEPILRNSNPYTPDWNTSLDQMDFTNSNNNYPTNQNSDYFYNNNFNQSSSPSSSIGEYPELELYYRHSLALSAVYCIAYIFIFVLGLIGNFFVISVVLRTPRMHTVTNFFIVNLALADILVIVFCLPATLMSNIFVPWVLGWLMCKTVPYIQGVSVAASVYSLIAVSLDRFLAIWWPLKLQITKKRARIMILCIWIIALVSTIPWALFFDLVSVFAEAPEVKICVEVWPPGTDGTLYFLLANLIACYLLPMLLISLCYILIWIKVWRRSIPGDTKDTQVDKMQQKSKVKVVKMLVAVVVLFVLSWLPLYVIFARIKFGGPMDSEEEEIFQIATPIAQWLGSSNSCINPILYAFFNKKYRRGFAAIIKSRTCYGRLRYSYYEPSSSSTRKSSHYQNQQNSSRKSQYSPTIKSDAVSYIFEGNNNCKKQISKQDSSLSRQMLLKQDSLVSRQSQSDCGVVSRQDSNNSRSILLRQDSNGNPMLAKQDSQISYIDTKRGQLMRQDSDLSKRSFLSKQESSISYIEPRKRGYLCKQDTQISYLESIPSKKNSLSSQDSLSFAEHKKYQLVKQDSVISFADPPTQPTTPRRHILVKQDSVISFADSRSIRGILIKQDSVFAYPPSAKTYDSTFHVSILKKSDSQCSSPIRKTIEFME